MIFFVLVGGAAFLFGGMVLVGAKSAIHEQLAALSFILGVVSWGVVGIMGALGKITEALGAVSKTLEENPPVSEIRDELRALRRVNRRLTEVLAQRPEGEEGPISSWVKDRREDSDTE